MPDLRKVRMVRCAYTVRGEDPWVPMGRARSRCPRCGAVVQDHNPRNAHYVELREVADA